MNLHDKKPTDHAVHAMIMAGGKGTRFWPLSRHDYAKQFLSLIGDQPLITQTINRIANWCPIEHRWILGNATQSRFLEPLQSLVPKAQILQEPVGRNTAACIGWATIALAQADPDAIIVVIPADQWIDCPQKFNATLQIAIHEAQTNHTIVTIGIPPTQAHTGFGYIQTIPTDASVYKVQQFVEKPDLKTATRYYQDPDFFWNAGMFICKAHVLADLFKTHLPNHYALFSQDTKTILAKYDQLEPISIDYGIMEKATDITRLVPAQFQWSDIGNWRAIASFLSKDTSENATHGNCVSIDANHNIIYAQPGKLIAVADISHMIIVATDDATLVIPQDSDQKIKDIYTQLPNQFR